LVLNLETTNCDAVHNQNEFQRLQTYQNLVNLNDCILFTAQSTLSVLSPLNDCYSLGYNNQHTMTTVKRWPDMASCDSYSVERACRAMRRILNWLGSTMSQHRLWSLAVRNMESDLTDLPRTTFAHFCYYVALIIADCSSTNGLVANDCRCTGFTNLCPAFTPLFGC